jgi:hypothetical protein
MDAAPALQAFAPLDGGPTTGFISSTTIAAITANAVAGLLPGATGTSAQTLPQQPNFYKQIQVTNTTNGVAFVNFGIGTTGVAAATVANSYPVLPNAKTIVTINGQYTAASVILASGSTAGSVIFTRGQGLP